MPPIRHRMITVDGLNIFVREARSRSRGGRSTASARRTTASSATLPTPTTASISAHLAATSLCAPATASSPTP